MTSVFRDGPFLSDLRLRRFAAFVAVPLVLGGAGCGEDCYEQPLCQSFDLLQACALPASCPQVGSVQLSPASPGRLSEATLGADSSITVPVAAGATMLATLPTLQVSLSAGVAPSVVVPTLTPGDATLTLDGAPFTACTPVVDTEQLTMTWTCPLPAGTQTVRIAVGPMTSAEVTMELSQSTCTESERRCAE